MPQLIGSGVWYSGTMRLKHLSVAAGSLLVACGCLHGQTLLIIAPAAFGDALKEYAEYKNGQMHTEVVTLEEVLSRTDGPDDAARLKRYLHRRWFDQRVHGDQARARYVL